MLLLGKATSMQSSCFIYLPYSLVLRERIPVHNTSHASWSRLLKTVCQCAVKYTFYIVEAESLIVLFLTLFVDSFMVNVLMNEYLIIIDLLCFQVARPGCLHRTSGS